jgi:hypothetical protein
VAKLTSGLDGSDDEACDPRRTDYNERNEDATMSLEEG